MLDKWGLASLKCWPAQALKLSFMTNKQKLFLWYLLSLTNTMEALNGTNVTSYEDFYGGYDEYDDAGGGGGFDPSEDRTFIFLVEGVALTAVSALGVVGTAMSVGVLVKRSVRETFSALLTGLAVCDTLFLLTSLVMFGLPKLWMWFAVNVTGPSAAVTFGLLHIWRVGSTYLTLSVTLER